MPRTLLAALALIALLALTGCSDGNSEKLSRTASKIGSIVEPREALAASAEQMDRENYYLEYEAKFEGKVDEENFSEAFEGTYSIAHRGDDLAFWMSDEDEGRFGFIDQAGKSYICWETRDEEDLLFDGEGCWDVTAGDELTYDADDYESLLDFEDFFFDTRAMLNEIADDEDIQIDEVDGRKIDGRDARCFEAKGDGTDATLCIDTTDGLLLLMEGSFEGEDGKLELKDSREPKDSDFDLPYEVTDFDFDFSGSNEPEEPDCESIPFVRIAGESYPWETAPALCPDVELAHGTGVDVLPSGEVLLNSDAGFIALSPACSARPIANFAFAFAADDSGNIYLVDGFGTATIRVLDPRGESKPIAGHDCATGKIPACDGGPPADGAATEVVLGTVLSFSAGTDGTIWFLQFGSEDDGDNFLQPTLRRVTSNGRIETVPADITKKFGDPWQVAASPDGSVYGADLAGRVRHLDRDGKVTNVADAGSCLAFDRNGNLWSYAAFDGELIVNRTNGKVNRFPFAPEDTTNCTAMAVEPDGDILFSGGGVGGSGLWRISAPGR